MPPPIIPPPHPPKPPTRPKPPPIPPESSANRNATMDAMTAATMNPPKSQTMTPVNAAGHDRACRTPQDRAQRARAYEHRDEQERQQAADPAPRAAAVPGAIGRGQRFACDDRFDLIHSGVDATVKNRSAQKAV